MLFRSLRCVFFDTSSAVSLLFSQLSATSSVKYSPAFFILYLESYISRLNVIPCHDLTLCVGEPDNAAAKQGQELRSEQTVINIHEQHHLYLFLRLNNSETITQKRF